MRPCHRAQLQVLANTPWCALGRARATHNWYECGHMLVAVVLRLSPLNLQGAGTVNACFIASQLPYQVVALAVTSQVSVAGLYA